MDRLTFALIGTGLILSLPMIVAIVCAVAERRRLSADWQAESASQNRAEGIADCEPRLTEAARIPVDLPGVGIVPADFVSHHGRSK